MLGGKKEIKLVLEDKSIFSGFAFGAKTSVAGEVVFNTGMAGYPEGFTDPSYEGQILVLTYPLIGNYGIPQTKQEYDLDHHFESSKVHISGLIIQEYSETYSHHEAKKSLGDWLKENNIPAITGIDTRALTKRLRSKGVMLGKIIITDDKEFFDPNQNNLVKQVSTKKAITYKNKTPHIALIDCGVKNNIIFSLIKRGATLTRVPWDYDIFTNAQYDGILISNGPGDPKMCHQTIKTIKAAIKREIPIFGICLGNQLLALAAGANTYKLKYGHRGQNQPAINLDTKRCYITTQNHGFAVDEKTLPAGWKPWFRNANDKTNEGIRHNAKPFFGFQAHPESMPGPNDTSFLFDDFLDVVRKNNEKKAR